MNRRHIERVDGLQDLREGVVIIRAHGIRQEEHAALREGRREGRLILANATCPEVGRVHAFIRTWRGRGYFTLILGQADHSEVIGHLSYAGPQGAVIRSIAEVDTLPDAVLGKVLVVAQTTFLTSDFWTLVNRIKERAGHTVVKNTICRETWLRQNEARDLVRKVDTVVVVGGKSSNNTRHLVGVAESLCPCGRRA